MMPTKTLTIIVTTLTLLACGCSDSTVNNAKRVVKQPAATLGATLPTTASAEPVAKRTLPTQALNAEATLPPQPLIEDAHHPDLHTPMEQTSNRQLSNVVLPVVKREKAEDGTTLQLLGFVSAKGLQTLLSEDGKLHLLGLGESADGAQIIGIEASAVTFQDGENEFDLSIFQQDGFHDPQEVFAASRNSLGGEAITPGVGSGFPGNVPGLAGALPGFPGGEAGAVPGLPGIGPGEEGGLPGIPGFKLDGSPADLPGLPGGHEKGLDGFGGLPAVDGRSEIPGLPQIDGTTGLPGLPTGVDGGIDSGLPGGNVPLPEDFPGHEGDNVLPGLEEDLPGMPTDTIEDVTSTN